MNLGYSEFVQLTLNSHRVHALRLVDASDAVAVGTRNATLPIEALKWTTDGSPREIARLELAAAKELLR